jgi:alpha-1,2-mannosyltransferase
VTPLVLENEGLMMSVVALQGRKSEAAAARVSGMRALKAAVIAGDLLAVAVFLFSYGSRGIRFGAYHIDLQVYRIGARTWLQGKSVYGSLPPTGHGQLLPFTYPPLSAVMAVPVAWLPVAVDGLAVTAGNVLLLYAVLRLFVRRLTRPATGTGIALGASWLAAALVPAAVVLDPVRVALVDGQIDIPLMALVAFDTLGPGLRIRGVRARGLLIGLAAALKLTPAAYVLFYLARRQYREATLAAASFAGFTLLGFLAAPRDSYNYWTHVVFQTDRIGAAAYASNQSIRGALARVDLTGPALDAMWFLLAGAVAVAVFHAARRLDGAVGAMTALLLTAVAELLISPISWTHHWVWAAPGLLLLAVAFRGRARMGVPAVMAAAGYVLFAIGPQWLLPHGNNLELSWSPWQAAVGDGYVWYAVAVLAVAVYAVHRWPACPRVAVAPIAAGVQADQGASLADGEISEHRLTVRCAPARRKGRRALVGHLTAVSSCDGAAVSDGQRPDATGSAGQRERRSGRTVRGGPDRRGRRSSVVVPRAGAGPWRLGVEPRCGSGGGAQPQQPVMASAGRAQSAGEAVVYGEGGGENEKAAMGWCGEARSSGGTSADRPCRRAGGFRASVIHNPFTFRACRIAGARKRRSSSPATWWRP